MWKVLGRAGKSIKGAFYSTIFAHSSGQGKCGVAIIRVSGKHAKETILRMTSKRKLPEPRKAIIAPILHPSTQEQLDRGLVLWFPGPQSFTGEDVCELHIHGGPAVVAAVLAGLSELQEYRPATAGEFTKRAFMAGKMDLTEVEGLADLIHAETEQQRRQALLQMEGSLAQLYNNWREKLLQAVAHVEAYIDFSEEDNIEDDVLSKTKSNLEELLNNIHKHLHDNRRGERLNAGVRTAILGKPNVGKSSLLNYLVQRPAAIVTPIAGTTRDIVEVSINIADYPVLIADTAGIRSRTNDIVEQEGIQRAQAWSKTADLILVLIDPEEILSQSNWNEFWRQHRKLFVSEHVSVLPIVNKIDLLSNEEKNRLINLVGDDAICISCSNEEGMAQLIKTLAARLKSLCSNPSRESPNLTRERHRHHLTECLAAIENGLAKFNETDASLAAHSLRKALKSMGRITGVVSSEDILDVIFRDFCIGK